jgi:hypothetical protein
MEPTDTNQTNTSDKVIAGDINEEQRQFLRVKAERNARRAAAMTDKWRDAEFRKKTLVAMKDARVSARWRAKMRGEKWKQAYKRADQTGVLPHWTPKRVMAIEPTGQRHIYDSIRQCGAHYGIKESNMRAILKYGREWNGISFEISEDA